MTPRYKLKRGKRSACEFDVLIYRDDRLCFRGSFTTDRDRRMTSDDVKVIEALKAGLATLNGPV